MARILVTRPQPAAARTAEALAALGHEAVLAPLLKTGPVAWKLPASLPQALLISSAAAPRHVGPAAAPLKPVPALCVGAATTAAATAAGFNAENGGENLAAVLAEAGRRNIATLLHLAGENRTRAQPPKGVALSVVTVYRARLLPLLDPGPIDAVLLFSARSARHFTDQWARLGHRLEHGRTPALVALSPAVARAAGPGWPRLAVAARPDHASLLAALAGLGL